MKTISFFCALAVCAAPSFVSAQQGDPVEAARAVDACNGNHIIKAVWLDDGRLGVTCPEGSVENTVIGGGGGATNFAIPLLLGVVAAAAAAGGGGSTSGTN